MFSSLSRSLLMAVALLSFSVTAAPKKAASKDAKVTIDGVAFHYRVYPNAASKKLPLLVLHGAYMSQDHMAEVASKFAKTRQVVTVDQRGHGRTGDVDGPITYEKLADDAAAVAKAAGLSKVDVFGYSMGAGAAIQLAIRYPELVAHLVSVSGGYASSGQYPELLAGIKDMKPEMFAGTPIEKEYKRLSPDGSKFAVLVEKLKALDLAPMNWPESTIKGIKARTLVVSGDHDVVMPEHSLKFFRLRGGAPTALVTQPLLAESPVAQLAILPGSSHIGVMAQTDLLVGITLPFLDEVKPVAPPGFF